MQLGRSYSDRGTFSCNSRHGVAPRLTRTSLQKNASHSSVHSFDLRQAWATRGGGGLGSGVREPATSRGAELAGAARHLRVPAARLAWHQRTSPSLAATGQEQCVARGASRRRLRRARPVTSRGDRMLPAYRAAHTTVNPRGTPLSARLS